MHEDSKTLLSPKEGVQPTQVAPFDAFMKQLHGSAIDNLYSKLHVNQPCKATLQSNKTGSEKLNVLISKRDAQGNLRRLRKRM
jgi:hypothetical protein